MFDLLIAMSATAGAGAASTTVPMTGLMSALIVALAGALGGTVNAFISDTGFKLPEFTMAGEAKIFQPGWPGNAFVGAVAALISWGLYSTNNTAVPITSNAEVPLYWPGFTSAILIGVGGARWLSAEVDKTLLRNAGAVAATKSQNTDLAAKIASLAPAQALKAAQDAQ